MRENEAQIWLAELDQDAATLARLTALLDPAERQRAARFHFDRDRDRFIAARGFLRELLGRELEIDPAKITFAQSANGKPRLAPGCQTPQDLRFNVSHSSALALYALTARREVGVDVERIKELPDMEGIGRLTFTSEEQKQLAAALPEGRTELFFRLWTRHEAIVKCTGEGIAGEGPPGFAGTVAEMAPAPGFLGAVAVERGELQLQAFKSSGRGPDDRVPRRIH